MTHVEQSGRVGSLPTAGGSPRGGAERIPGLVAVVIPALVMLLLARWGLGRSMWNDEAITYDVARRTVGQILAVVRHVDIVHAAYYLAMHVWMQLGDSAAWLRVPSVLASGISAGLLGWLGSRLVNPRVGLVAGLLFCTSPVVSMYAQEGRSYAIVSALVLGATAVLVIAVDAQVAGRPRWVAWLCYAALAAAACLVHEFAVLALAAHAVSLALGGFMTTRASSRVGRAWLASLVPAGLVLVILVVASAQQQGQVSWIKRPTGAAIWNSTGMMLGRPLLLTLVVAALLVVGTLTQWSSRTSVSRPGRTAPTLPLGRLALPLLLVPPVVLISVSQMHPLYHERYVLYSIAGVPLLVAAGLEWLVRVLVNRRTSAPLARWAAMLLVVAVIGLSQLPQQAFVRTPESRSDDLAGVAALVQQHVRPGDAVMFVPNRFRAAALAYPESFAGIPDVTLEVGRVESATLLGIDLTLENATAQMLTHPRIWVVTRPNFRILPTEPAAAGERAVLKARFRALESYSVRGCVVTLYERR